MFNIHIQIDWGVITAHGTTMDNGFFSSSKMLRPQEFGVVFSQDFYREIFGGRGTQTFYKVDNLGC